MIWEKELEVENIQLGFQYTQKKYNKYVAKQDSITLEEVETERYFPFIIHSLLQAWLGTVNIESIVIIVVVSGGIPVYSR